VHHGQPDRPDRLDRGSPADPERGETREDRVEVGVEGQEEEAFRRSDRLVPGGAVPSVTTSSTMPLAGSSVSPRKTECNSLVAAPNSEGQGPSNEWSINTSSPRPSRQKVKLAARSRVTIAE